MRNDRGKNTRTDSTIDMNDIFLGNTRGAGSVGLRDSTSPAAGA